MMTNQLIAFLLILVFTGNQLTNLSSEKEPKELYPISENGLWGYIDKTGKVLIEPKFLVAGQFSEGLAPVRLSGTYGYIDKRGEFLIPAQFDVAYSFQLGQAKVYLNGKPYYIDKKGNKSFEHPFTEITGFDKNEYSLVGTEAKNYGIIDRNGRLLLDTIYKRISPFTDGRAIVLGRDHLPYPKKGEEVLANLEIGVVASNGEFVVPFGKYRSISEFKNGFAKVEWDVPQATGYSTHEGVIDTNGKLRFTVPSKKWRFDFGNDEFSEGLAIIDIYTVDPDTMKVWSSSVRSSYKGVINGDGEIVISNENWDEITPFKNNRAFVQDVHGGWYLIDRKGQVLNQEPYTRILYKSYYGNPDNLFQKGIQFVKTDQGWGAIDTTGKFSLEPKELGFHINDLNWKGDFIFFEEKISKEGGDYSYKHGFMNIRSGLVVNPRFNSIPFAEFEDDLIYVIEDERMGYIDHQGNYVWREKRIEKQNPLTLNIDYMNRGYFYASSTYIEELAGLGGWGGSANNFKKIPAKHSFKMDALSMQVQTNARARWSKTYQGMNLYIVNTEKDTIYFDAQDSRLYLKIQAKDKNGLWKDIEYLPGSWCGNSYHTLFLPPDHHWEFVIPVYEGEFKTQLRAELVYKRDINKEEESILYSTAFEGSINPGQFWRKNQYMPAEIMDPYND